MKKFLLFVLLVLIFFTVDHPIIKEPRDKLFNRTVSELSEASKLKHNAIATEAQKLIAQSLTLSRDEIDYLSAQLDTEPRLKHFHERFCKRRELNPHFVGDRLLKLCQITEAQIKKIQY